MLRKERENPEVWKKDKFESESLNNDTSIKQEPTSQAKFPTFLSVYSVHIKIQIENRPSYRNTNKKTEALESFKTIHF